MNRISTPEVRTRETKTRRAITAGSLGFFVDMFDVYLPTIALAPALAYFLSPELSPETAVLVASLLLVSTLLGRPLGALIFGHYADRIGRKRSLIVSVGGFGVLTIVLGCMPGYDTWGIASVVAFVILRFVIGIFIGGEYTAASPLAMEYSPKKRRGFNSGLIMAGFPAAFVAVSLITIGMLQIAPAGDPTAPYSVWGWRIPFFIGGILAIAFVLWVAREVDESEQFEKIKADETSKKAPLLQLFTRENLPSFLQIFVVMSGFWFTAYAGTAILPNLLTDPVGLDPSARSWMLVIVFVVATFAYIGGGAASQVVGRKKFMIGFAFVNAILAPLAFAWLVTLRASDGTLIIALAASVTIVVTLSQWGMIIAYVNERFATGVRASAFGLGYSLAVVIPSFFAFYQAKLSEFMPMEYTVIPILILGAILIIIGALLGPETRDVDI